MCTPFIGKELIYPDSSLTTRVRRISGRKPGSVSSYIQTVRPLRAFVLASIIARPCTPLGCAAKSPTRDWSLWLQEPRICKFAEFVAPSREQLDGLGLGERHNLVYITGFTLVKDLGLEATSRSAQYCRRLCKNIKTPLTPGQTTSTLYDVILFFIQPFPIIPHPESVG